MRTLYLHIGLPKTGTTFLQNQVFPSLGVQYVHKSVDLESRSFIKSCHQFFRKENHKSRSAKRNLKSAANKILNEGGYQGKEDILISDENISVKLTSIWRDPIPSVTAFSKQLDIFAEIFSERGFDCHIICSVRRQDNWLASRYAESSKIFKDFCQSHFDDFIRSNYLETISGYSILNYERLYSAVIESFGERAHFLSYENLEECPNDEIKSICRLIGDENASITERPFRRENIARSSSDTWKLKGIPGKELNLLPESRAMIMKHFSDSNLRFKSMSGVEVGDSSF